MPQIFLQFVLPLAFEAIKMYIKNSSSKNDDKVLELTKESCQYLLEKENNTVDEFMNSDIQSRRMIEGV